MRRPPDKDGRPGMSERDIDSSNATLNTLFGGARQKSWLLGPRTPVRPTPRPSISKAPGGTTTTAQNNAAAILLSPAPSEEPSPILTYRTVADDIHSQDQWQIHDTKHQRLGGSVAQRPPCITQLRAAANLPSKTDTPSRVPQSAPVRASRSSPVNIHTGPSIPSPTIARSTSATISHFPADGQITIPSAMNLRSPSLALPSPDLEQPLGSRHPPMAIAQSPNEMISDPIAVHQSPHEQLLSPSPMSSPPPKIALHQPPLPAAVLIPKENQRSTSPSSSHANPHKRQRIQTPAPSLKSRIALINAHIESVGGPQYLNNDLERPRFQLLAEACNAEDVFYIALHQVFCIWDSPNRGLLGTIRELPALSVLAISFKVLGTLIRENRGLAPNHLKWFIEFPSPLINLMSTSEGYQKVMGNVGQYLGKLASDWAPFSRLCATRGYPPLVDELIETMGLTSPILQHIMFTATRRNLGVDDNKHGEEMEAVFGQDKQGHHELATRLSTSRPPTEKEIVERNQMLIDKYLNINNHRLQSRRMSRPVVDMGIGSHLINSPTVLHQPNVQQPASSGSDNILIAPRPQNFLSNGGQNLPSPDQWHRNQNTQQNHSNLSPDLLVQAIASRPLSGKQIQSNAPSPTLLQGLSMSSPVVQSPQLRQQGFQWSASTPLMNHSHQLHNLVTGRPTWTRQLSPQQQTPVQQHEQIIAQHQQQSAMHALQLQHQPQPQIQQQVHPQILRQPQMQRQQQVHPQMYQQGQRDQQRLAQYSPHQAHLPAPQYIQQQAQQIQGQVQQHLDQVRQHVATATQQVLSVNRAAQSRGNSDVVDIQQRGHSLNNSVMSAGGTSARSNPPDVALPRPIRSFIPIPVVQDQAILAYTNAQPLQRNLVPPIGYQQPAQPTNPEITALHQAHARSPRLEAENLPSGVPEDDPSRRYYQSVKDLATAPKQIPVMSSMSYLEFLVPEESFALVSKDKVIGSDRLPVRKFKRGSLQYRLRCIQPKCDASNCSISEWIVSDTVWPETVFVEINAQQLEVRRKNHYGKDLPVDITQYVVPNILPGNVNRIKISIPRLRKATRDKWYFVAVEVVEVLQHSQIMEMCTKNQRIPASRTLDAIKKSLAPPPTDEDDDFAMVVSDLSIDLADPFTARIFDTPVRGNCCLHRECFDLETFLLTRNSKPKRPNQPSMIDIWKCPLCGRDARPYSLQVDDFLASVRAELAAQDNLDTKAILISADGGWRAKPQPRPVKRKATNDLNDEDPDSSDGEGAARKQQVVGRQNNPYINESGSGRASREVEVIELDG